MNIKRIKIVAVPSFHDWPVSSAVLAPRLLPIGVAMIAASCRKAGYVVEQDDLNVKLHTDNFNAGAHVGESDFLSFQRIVDFIQGKPDGRLEATLRLILGKTNWDGFDAYLFSCSAPRDITSASVFLGMGYLLKKQFPHRPFIAGGNYFSWHISDDLFRIAKKHNVLDYIIEGRAERSILDLFSALKSSGSLNAVAGLIFEKDGAVFKNPPSEPLIPALPDYDGLPIDLYRNRCLAKYSQGEIKEDRDILILSYAFSSGCPHQCAFCLNPAGKYFGHKSIPEIVRELQFLKDKYRTRYFAFHEATFNFSRPFTLELCQAFIKNKLDIKWSACAHAGNLDRELLSAMKESGAICLYIGFETGGEKLQQYIEKKLDLKNLSEVFALCDEMGIWSVIEVIVGFPFEKTSDVQKTISFLRNNKGHIDERVLNSFRLVPTSSFILHPEKFGLANIGTWDICETAISRLKYGTTCASLGIRFDEINGLKWEEKKKMTAYSYRKVFSAVRFPAIPCAEDLSYLFYLYESLSDKSKIKKLYKEYAKGLQKKALFRSWQPFLNAILFNQGLLLAKAMHICYSFISRGGDD